MRKRLFQNIICFFKNAVFLKLIILIDQKFYQFAQILISVNLYFTDTHCLFLIFSVLFLIVLLQFQ